MITQGAILETKEGSITTLEEDIVDPGVMMINNTQVITKVDVRITRAGIPEGVHHLLITEQKQLVVITLLGNIINSLNLSPMIPRRLRSMIATKTSPK